MSGTREVRRPPAVPRVGDRLRATLVDAAESAPVRVLVDTVSVRPDGDDGSELVEVGFTMTSSVALTAPIQPLPPTAVLVSDGFVVGVAEVPTVSAAVAVRLTPGRPHHGVSSVRVGPGVLSDEVDVLVVLSTGQAGDDTSDPVVHRSPAWRLRP